MISAPDYSTQSAMSDPGRHRQFIDALPGDVGELAQIVQGWCVHDFVAEPFYGLKVPQERAGDIHIRRVEAMLDCLLAMDSRPLDEARPVAKRLAIRCRHYALLHIAALRAKGVAARLRGGFSAYFNPPYFEDHWITEYWHAAERRWVLVDPQLDQVWMEKLGDRDDPLDLARDRFIVSADAWKSCRSGAADPQMFGIGVGDLRGLWFIASSLVRDLAALNKVELLPWDVWGVQPSPDAEMTPAALALLDRVADLTADPDRDPAMFSALYAGEPGLKAGGEVFNAITMRLEPVGTPRAA